MVPPIGMDGWIDEGRVDEGRVDAYPSSTSAARNQIGGMVPVVLAPARGVK
jgi:hypothetical protein